MKNQLNKLQEYIAEGLDLDLFYSIHLQSDEIIFQGNLTYATRTHIEVMFECQFILTEHRWIEYKNDSVRFILTHE